jgi:drug/metabolite transporter (DMT)-like permease
VNPLVGQLAALGTAICWSFTALFFSYSGRRIGSLVVSQSRLLFALLLLILLHFFLEGSIFPLDAAPFRWGWLSVSSILGLVLGDTLLFYAFVMIGPRLSTLMMSLVPIINTIAGWILFDELLGPLEILGTVLAVGGVFWVVSERRRGTDAAAERQYGRGILLGLGGAVGQATNLLTARYGLVGGYSTLSATLIRIFVAVLVLWGIALLRRSAGAMVRSWRDRPAFAALIAGTVVGPVLGIWLSLVAVQQARIGIASTLMALPPVLLIPIEYAIDRKPISARSIVGTLIALSGVALILLPR